RGGEPGGARGGGGRPLVPTPSGAGGATGRGRDPRLASPGHDDDRPGRAGRPRPSTAAPRGPAPGGGPPRGRAAPRSPPGRRRHQVVPLPRSRTPARAGSVDVGPPHRDGDGHPPEHRLPLPDGPVLLGPAPGRRARLGVAAGVARLDPVRRRARRALPAAVSP